MKRALLMCLVLAGMPRCAASDATKQSSGVRKITPDMLRFDENSSTAVISGAQKFIIPVPAYGASGEPLIYPKSHERAGQPIVDYEGKAIEDGGVIVKQGAEMRGVQPDIFIRTYQLADGKPITSPRDVKAQEN